MSRRRYISTEISTDPAVCDLAERYGEFAALLYTWMIPHAEDNGCIDATDLRKLKLLIVPGFHWKAKKDIEDALVGMHEVGLIRWNLEKGLIQFPPSFYKYQKYISDKRRGNAGEALNYEDQDEGNIFDANPRTSAQIDADSRNAQNSAQNSASLRFKSSLKSSENQNTCVCDVAPESQELKPIPAAENPFGAIADDGGARESGRGNEYSEEFEAFWREYPRRKEKAKAYRRWRVLLKHGAKSEDLIFAAIQYAHECRVKRTEEQYIKFGATFLGPDQPWQEYLAGAGISPNNQPPRPPRKNDYNSVVVGGNPTQGVNST